MRITIAGTGYVGLVTGVALAEIGHDVTCIDIDASKVDALSKGKSPIYEPGLEDMLQRNIANERLRFTVDSREAYMDAEVIYIAVGTPSNEDGTVDLTYIERVASDIANVIIRYTIIVTKSTVPVGTNERLKVLINRKASVPVDLISNPEFLREGSALHDMFNGDRIVIGADRDEAAIVIANLNKPFGIPIFKTDIRSAEMIKYASNAFLATKISFINEISTLCEKLNANVEAVSYGMGLDNRIGNQFLQAGIGYGGSCFPKDTKALVQLAGNVQHEFQLLRSVIEVNNKQKRILIDKLLDRFGGVLANLKIAVLGLSFKANTDDLREAASIVVIEELIRLGAQVVAYDPIAIKNARTLMPGSVRFAETMESALIMADAALILTQWEEITSFRLYQYKALMKTPVILDGRNCYSLPEAEQAGVAYDSIGRPKVNAMTLSHTI